MIQRFTVKVLGDAQGLVAAAQAHALGLLHYAVGNGHAGAHGVCVGHQVYKGIAACRSCLAAGGDVLFILKAGRAPMAVGVHKAAQRRKAAAVQRFLAGPGFQLQALRKNFAVPHAKVKLFAICASKILQDHGIFSFLFCPAAPGGSFGFWVKKNFSPIKEKSKANIKTGKNSAAALSHECLIHSLMHGCFLLFFLCRIARLLRRAAPGPEALPPI